MAFKKNAERKGKKSKRCHRGVDEFSAFFFASVDNLLDHLKE